LAGTALVELIRVARTRNARERITGILLTDGLRFIQYLEGPPAAVQRLWGDLQCDPRHACVEQLNTARGMGRLFPGCAMRLLVDGGPLFGFGLDEFQRGSFQAVCRDRGRILPAVEALAFQQALPAVGDLATLFAQRDEPTASRFHNHVLALQPSLTALGSYLVEPVLAVLGTGWCRDELGSAELAIARSRLQALIRGVAGFGDAGCCSDRESALVVPFPGEDADCGVTLAAAVLEGMGWKVERAFPSTAAELVARVAQQPPALLHLAVSDVCVDGQCLAPLAAAIEMVRATAPGRTLFVRVSGRLFEAHPGLAEMIGADSDRLIRGGVACDSDAATPLTTQTKQTWASSVVTRTLAQVRQRVRARRFGKGLPPHSMSRH
jgi:hypothetical protein